MKFDVNVLRYLSKDDFRVLTAVEMGMRNHEIVPAELIDRIARLKRGGTYKVLKNLLRHKLVHHDSTKYDGYRLTYLGYDFLAIKTLVNRGVFASVGRQLGVGKESDIFEVATEDGEIMAIKLHRLGRVSFRAVKSKRDYLLHRRSYNWLYLSRLAALKEFSFMEALNKNNFPVPTPVDCNRHCVVMSLVEGYPLVQVKQLANPGVVFNKIIGLVQRLAEHGIIHCDFNEFNIMIDDYEKITMIDFPQMVSVNHRNAEMYFDRDVECVFKFFRKRFNLSFIEELGDGDRSELDTNNNRKLSFSSIDKSSGTLDKEVAASGFTRKNQEEIEMIITGTDEIDSESDDDIVDERSPPDEDIETSVKEIDSLRVVNHIITGTNEINSESDDDIVDDIVDERFPPHEDIQASTNDMDSLHLANQQESTVKCNENGEFSENNHFCKAGENNVPGTLQASEEEDNQDPSEDDAALLKRLNKHKKHAIAVARGKQKKSSSRNTYKDKGGKSSSNSKVQRQSSFW